MSRKSANNYNTKQHHIVAHPSVSEAVEILHQNVLDYISVKNPQNWISSFKGPVSIEKKKEVLSDKETLTSWLIQ